MSGYFNLLKAIIWRELLRFIHQRERFLAALVRPLVWLFIFATGFRSALGLSIIPPYETYISYETYIVPGLCAMIQLFSTMQSALSIVYDQEMGAMRLLLTSPMPRWWVLFCKLAAAVVVSIVQIYAFLLVAYLYGIQMNAMGYLYILFALTFSGLMLGSIGLVLASFIRRLQNFSGIMNFVIFPMFFMSSALYPLWKIQENSPLLCKIAAVNPFTHAVESIRFALYEQPLHQSLIWVIVVSVLCFGLSIWGFNPKNMLMRRKAQT